MDAIDNTIFATLLSPQNPALAGGTPITGDYFDLGIAFGAFAPINFANPATTFGANWQFPLQDKETFVSFQEYQTIETAIQRHWYDINGNGIAPFANGFEYNWGVGNPVSDFTEAPPYHFIYSYLIENTRILQIFERVLDRYMNDEYFGINNQQNVFQWLLNSEALFFKDHSVRTHNIRSVIRPAYDANRRNAYHRMFGIDLAFGDINSPSGGSLPYHKAKVSNQQFVPLFEKYLSEVWQGYINARNTSGANTSDVNILIEIAQEMRELLEARRGMNRGPGVALTLNSYANTNLAREEFSSAMLLSWFAFIISADTDVVAYLNCQSSTIGERLIKIGQKVGIPAHSKCQAIFDMAGAASNILTRIEIGPGGLFEDAGWMQGMLSSLNPPVPPAMFAPSQQSDYMTDFLTVINNWEKATGHRIKNPESNIRGTVSIAQTQTQRTNGRLVGASLT